VDWPQSSRPAPPVFRLETCWNNDLVRLGSVAATREQGFYRMEDKEYVVADGDVLLFKFNV
jgi:ribosome-binding ATPase YchF (GTP1/OBG family)